MITYSLHDFSVSLLSLSMLSLLLPATQVLLEVKAADSKILEDARVPYKAFLFLLSISSRFPDFGFLMATFLPSFSSAGGALIELSSPILLGDALLFVVIILLNNNILA